jgi:hypothetical protein
MLAIDHTMTLEEFKIKNSLLSKRESLKDALASLAYILFGLKSFIETESHLIIL